MSLAEEVSAKPLCRRTVVEWSERLPAELPLGLWAHERRGDAFVVVLLAALHAGRSVDAEVLVEGASLLDDPLYLAVAAGRVRGDVAAALVAAVEDRRLNDPWLVAVAMWLAASWCRREGVVIPAGVVRWARRAARVAQEDDEIGLGLATAALTGDEGLADLLSDVVSDAWSAIRDETAAWVEAAFVGSVLTVVPELPPAAPRGGPKVGRNDACPCGSGNKFKKCCEGKVVAPRSSPRVAADLSSPMWQLARWSAEEVPEGLRPAWFDELVGGFELDAARRALPSLPAAHRARALQALVAQFSAAGRIDEARALAEELGAEAPPELDVQGRTPARAVKALERLAVAAIDGGPAAEDVAVAALLSPFPALGLMVARGVLADLDDDGAEVLLARMHDLRDELGWAPWDPAADQAPEPAKAPNELTAVREALAATDAARRRAEQAFAKTERERARLEGEAARAAHRVASSPVSVDGAELRQLREELRSLKLEHKAIHDERNTLRREVAAWRAQVAEHEAEQAVDDDDGDDDDDAVIVAPAGLRLPAWPADFLVTVQSLPPSVGRSVMARLGELCSGRPSGWRETKPLQSLDNVWRAKIGRSYRMLFRVYDGRVEVLDVVHRQDLEKRLNQLHGLR
jgi:hypothetical protein